MKMIRHTLSLQGEGCHGRRARPEVIGTVLLNIKPMIQGTVRMGFLRSSRAVGRPLTELRAAWDVQFLGQTRGMEGATLLHFEAPSFEAAAPALFDQGLLWEEGPSRTDTAFDLIGDMLGDVAQKAGDSARYDTPLLQRVAAFERALRRGIETMAFAGHRISKAHPGVIDRTVIDAARSLAADTPAPKRVRVQGTLDMIRVSDHVLELILKDRSRVRAVWTGAAIVAIRDLLNQPVLIEGDAVFRPSGSLLRIDTEAIAPASERDSFFSVMPVPGAARIRKSVFLHPQTPTSGYAAIFGQWPGDETEEELLAALEEIG